MVKQEKDRKYLVIYHGKTIIYARFCKDFFSQARGLMFQTPLKNDQGLLIDRGKESITKSSIHMLFVFFPIDVVWLDNKRRVVDKRENIKPFTPLVVPRKATQFILELPQGMSKNIELGDIFEFKKD